ncbi:MAG: hypothetical protein RI891_863, partial [Gemmatimonadota bacterium]
MALSSIRRAFRRLAPPVALGALLLWSAGCARESDPAPLTIHPLPAPAMGDAAEPFVASTPEGGVTLSWLERQPDS